MTPQEKAWKILKEFHEDKTRDRMGRKWDYLDLLYWLSDYKEKEEDKKES